MANRICRSFFVAGVAAVIVISVDCARTAPPPTSVGSGAEQLIGPMDLSSLPTRGPDKRIAYGDDSSQFGELRVPGGNGPHPLAILIHGGCFKAAYATTRDLSAMADALKDDGIATWSIEYRRVGQSGGGWPGTYLDVAHAVDHVRSLASEYHLDLSRVVVVGHSAGGHLAMWAASRSRLPVTSNVYVANPLPIRGVMDLAGPLDLTANIGGYETLCRDSVITSLLGGTPATVPERYAHASPMKLVPLGVNQVLILGEHEDFVPRPIAEAYVQAARRAGDSVRLIVIPRVGHFEIASPKASTWTEVEGAIRTLLDGRLPAERQ